MARRRTPCNSEQRALLRVATLVSCSPKLPRHCCSLPGRLQSSSRRSPSESRPLRIGSSWASWPSCRLWSCEASGALRNRQCPKASTRLAGREMAITMTSIDDDLDPQGQQLERMKNDFLVAQQRRRERAASRRDDTGDTGDTGDGDGPPLAGPVASALRP